MQLSTAKTNLCSLLDISYSDIAYNGLFADSDLTGYIQDAATEVWNLHPWPQKQGAETISSVTTPYIDVPSSFEYLSTFLIVINGNSYKKWAFDDYNLYFQENSNATDYVFAEYAGELFINQLSYTSGMSADLYGLLTAPVLVNPTDEVPFTPGDAAQNAGTNVIVRLAQANALASNKLKQFAEAGQIREQVMSQIEEAWKPYQDAKNLSQRNNRPFFNVPNFFGMTPNDDAYNLGRFNW